MIILARIRQQRMPIQPSVGPHASAQISKHDAFTSRVVTYASNSGRELQIQKSLGVSKIILLEDLRPPSHRRRVELEGDREDAFVCVPPEHPPHILSPPARRPLRRRLLSRRLQFPPVRLLLPCPSQCPGTVCYVISCRSLDLMCPIDEFYHVSVLDRRHHHYICYFPFSFETRVTIPWCHPYRRLRLIDPSFLGWILCRDCCFLRKEVIVTTFVASSACLERKMGSCLEKGKVLIVWYPLLRGVLTGRNWPELQSASNREGLLKKRTTRVATRRSVIFRFYAVHGLTSELNWVAICQQSPMRAEEMHGN